MKWLIYFMLILVGCNDHDDRFPVDPHYKYGDFVPYDTGFYTLVCSGEGKVIKKDVKFTLVYYTIQPLAKEDIKGCPETIRIEFRRD